MFVLVQFDWEFNQNIEIIFLENCIPLFVDVVIHALLRTRKACAYNRVERSRVLPRESWRHNRLAAKFLSHSLSLPSSSLFSSEGSIYNLISLSLQLSILPRSFFISITPSRNPLSLSVNLESVEVHVISTFRVCEYACFVVVLKYVLLVCLFIHTTLCKLTCSYA